MTNSLVSVNLSSEELSALKNNLRFEFGPSVVTSEREKELRTMLALVDKDIEGRNSEIARLGLETQRAKLLSLLSPMRKLPSETLLHIFQDVCEENFLQCYPWMAVEIPTKMTSPVITYLPTIAISSVCSRWHELALSAPRLWANLKVETHTTPLDKDKIFETFAGFNDTVARYLERSGDSPLRLALTIYGPTAFKEIPCLIGLTEHAWRWKTFKHSGGPYSLLMQYNILSGIHFPLLDTIEGVLWLDLGLFMDSPRLRALSTYGRHRVIRSAHKAFYNQLDCLDCRYYSPSDLGNVLPSCPSLKSLKLGYIPTFRPDDAQVSGTWHNITSFALVNGGASDMMFACFNFPSLKKLVVDGGYNPFPVDFPVMAVTSFISRSSCMITTFVLRVVSLPDLDLIAVLRVMPALLHLEVDEKLQPCGYPEHQSPITSHFLSTLTHNQSTSIALVPYLHSFHLRSISKAVDAFDDAAFVSMVVSRWYKPGSELSAEMLAMGRACIRSVVLKFTSREADADIYKPLQILDTEGLRVVVSGPNGIQI